MDGGIKKEPGAPAAHPGPVKWKTKLNDAAPAAERKAGSLAYADAKRRADSPAQDAHKRLNLAPFPGGRISYSSGPARTACGAGPSLKSAPA
jgi:hypothetical protein